MDNEKKNIKTKSLLLVPLAALVFALALAGTDLIAALATFIYPDEAEPFVSKAYSYSWTDEDAEVHNEEVIFDCYPIASGYSGDHPGIAVAWHDEAESPLTHNTPTQLQIPNTLEDEESNVYDVIAIYKGGFRFCDFTTISLPNTIQEIGEEAFAYCLNLTEFSLPYFCNAISPSMLLDCRNLETFSFRKEDGTKTTANSVVTSVGDHAFTNCLKLKGFSCPTTLIHVGDCAFQNCKKLTSIFFPKTTWPTPDAVPVAERIHVGNYAFSECDSLTMVFFDVNMWSFGEYCFAKCNLQKLNLNYTGDETDFEDPEKMGEWDRSPSEHHKGINTHWRDRYTALGNAEQFHFVGGRGKFDYDHNDNYPGLYFTIDNDIRDLMLDQSILQTASNSWQAKIFRILGNSTLGGTDDNQIDKNIAPTFENEDGITYKYATIIQFEPPESTDFPDDEENPYYSSGTLRIPATVKADDGKTYPVRVIDSNVFKDHNELTSVIFGEHLTQVRHHAFLGCDNIASLNFSNCKDLLEMSYEVFHSLDSNLSAYNTKNTKVTSLQLPDCLKYIGASAFLGFSKVSSFHMSQSTVFIGQSAFQDLGADISGLGEVDMVLPNTLRDGPVDQAKPAYGFKIYRYTANSIWDECIQKEAFKNAKCLRSVKMQEIPTDSALWAKVADNPTSANPTPKVHDVVKPFRMGFQINAFEGCSSMVRFEANKLLYVIGKEAFKGCTNLKEMFLTTFGTKRTNVTNSCAWGFNGSSIAANLEGSIFGTDSVFTDLVIYVDDPGGPALGNTSQQNKTKWNSVSATYPNEFSTSTVALVPYYNGVVRSEVKYYDLNSSAATTPVLDSTNFTSPSVAFVQKTNDYTITRCYCGSSHITSDIDMSKFENASSIKTIGSGSFGQMDGYLPGRTIILPSSVTTIEDRAFYRKSNTPTNDRGVQIVTYKDGGSLQTIAGKDNYCILPPSVTSVGRLAFYNNCFESIYIKGNLSYLGNTAFGVYPYTDAPAASRNTVNSISLGPTENTFKVSSDNGGLYYKESGHETLIYQPGSYVDGKDETDDTEMRIDGDTLAIGARACANTTYSSVKIPSSVTTIYGGAFTRCLNLSTFTFNSTPRLKYIGATAWTSANGGTDTETEVWSGSNCNAASTMNDTPGSTAIGFEDYYRVFYGTPLTAFDFTKLNDCLVKIGYGAFEGCSSLVNMVGSQKYSYYKWTGTSTGDNNSDTLPTTPEKIDNQTEFNKNVLDLSGCSKLRAIGFKAFKGCTSIKYVHLPNNYDPDDGKALYLGSGEPESGHTINQGSDESVFNEMTGAKIFVGEKSVTANRAHVTENQNRYPQKTFDGNKKALFFAERETDLWTGGEASYWYQLPDADNGTKRFVWFDKKANAISFFRSSYFAGL